MNVFEAITKSEAELRREVLLETLGLMEFLDKYEDEMRLNEEGSLIYNAAEVMHEKSASRFERNIKLLSVLKQVEVGE